MSTIQQISSDPDKKLSLDPSKDFDPDKEHIEEEKKDVTEVDVVTFKEALEARRSALVAMPEERILRRARLDVVTVSAMASTAASRVAEMRGELVAQFGRSAGDLLDGLEITARAARQAEVEHDTSEDASELQALHQEVLGQYERLIIDADSLCVRGFLVKERLAGSRDTRSYQGALSSLLGVINVLRESWPTIQTKTPIVMADLDHADAVASRMSTALTTRQSGTARIAAAETRVRALSLLVREYELLRRMVSFLRWFDGDADSIVPSLYAGRGGRRPKDEPLKDGPLKDGPSDPVSDDVIETDTPVTPVAGPVPNNGGGPFTA